VGNVSQSMRIRCKQGAADACAAGFAGMLEIVSQEPGTLVYIISRSDEDPDVFYSFELFTDEAARQAHETNPVGVEYFQSSGMGELFTVIDSIGGVPVLAA
jgi:quinol monooxygenase YgiN